MIFIISYEISKLNKFIMSFNIPIGTTIRNILA